MDPPTNLELVLSERKYEGTNSLKVQFSEIKGFIRKDFNFVKIMKYFRREKAWFITALFLHFM